MQPLGTHDLVNHHLLPIFSACAFIGIFVISVPVVYMLDLSPATELFLFGLLFGLCHLANWPMLRVRWRLWFRGRLTPYAAMCTTALLFGSFGIPFILLVDLLQ